MVFGALHCLMNLVMTILKAVYENMDSSFLKKNIYMELISNRKYLFIYNGLLNKSEYETYSEAVHKNSFFNNEREGVYGKVKIEYNDKRVFLDIYSDILLMLMESNEMIKLVGLQ